MHSTAIKWRKIFKKVVTAVCVYRQKIVLVKDTESIRKYVSKKKYIIKLREEKSITKTEKTGSRSCMYRERGRWFVVLYNKDSFFSWTHKERETTTQFLRLLYSKKRLCAQQHDPHTRNINTKISRKVTKKSTKRSKIILM
jgi:hypothetical protein